MRQFPLTYDELKPYYTLPKPDFIKQATFLASDTYNEVRVKNVFGSDNAWNNYDEVIPNVYLGRLPYIGMNLPDSKVVVSVSTYEELAGRGLTKDIVKPLEYQLAGMLHIFLHMPDFSDEVSISDTLNAVLLMHECLKSNENPELDEDGQPLSKFQKIYIHCKAGRSRSLMVLIVYLLIFGCEGLPAGSDIENIIIFIKSQRVQVDLGQKKKQKALEIYDYYQKNKDLLTDEVDFMNLSQDEYLSSLTAKDEIRKLPSFVALAIYATQIESSFKVCKRTDHVRELLVNILDAKDGNWYEELLQNKGPAQRFIDAHSGDQSEKDRRQEFIDNIRKDLKIHLLIRGFILGQQKDLAKINNEKDEKSSLVL